MAPLLVFTFKPRPRPSSATRSITGYPSSVPGPQPRHLLVQLPHSLVLVRTAAPHLLHLGLSFHDSTTPGWKAGPTPPGPGPWARTPCSVPGCHKLRKLAN